MPGQHGSALRRQVAYEAIRAQILHGELPPGTLLSELDLGRALGTSRTPVREALMRLHEEGLIDIVPRRGPIVRILPPQEMLEILQVRESLEGLASRLAAARIPAARVKELRAQWEELRAALSEATLDTVHRKGYEFHDIVIAAAENRTLARLLEGIRGRLDSSRQLYLKTLGPLALKRARLSCEEHLRVIDALEAADPQQSEALMRDHLRQLRAEILGGRLNDE